MRSTGRHIRGCHQNAQRKVPSVITTEQRPKSHTEISAYVREEVSQKHQLGDQAKGGIGTTAL